MGLLEDILARAQYTPAAPNWPAIAPPVDEAALAEAAREAAGAKLASANRKRPPNPLTLAPDAQAAGIQLAMDQAPAGTGVPFSTQAGMLAPPVTVNQPVEPGPAVPLPMARPAEADLPAGTPTDVSAVSRQPSVPPNLVPPVAAAAPVAAEPSMFGRLGSGLMSGLADNSNALLALGAGFAGAPNIGQAISRASAAAIPAHAADVKQRLTLQAQTYGTKALIDAGVPIQQAIAAQGDPDLKKALIKNYIEDRAKKIVEVGQDPNTGAKIFAQHDPFTGALTPVDASKLQGGSSAAAAADSGVTGPDYIASLKDTNPDRARKVEAIIRGDEPFPTGRAAISPVGAALIRDVYRAEPGASASDFSTRQATQKSYTSGNDARVTKSINTTLHHAETLERAINELDNFSTLPGVLNPARSLIKGQYDSKYQKAKGDYETAVANFAKELDFAVSGGRPTVSGTKHQMEGFSLNAPKVEQMAKLQQGVDLLKGRLESHAEGYNKGRRVARTPADFIDPVNRKFYERVLSEGGATIGGEPAAVPTPAAPVVPKPGRYVFDPATGKMAPVQ